MDNFLFLNFKPVLFSATYHDAVAKLGAVVRESDAELTSDADKSRRRAKKNSSSDEDGHSDGSFKTKRVSSPPKFHLTLGSFILRIWEYIY